MPPWEKYQQQSSPSAGKPWERYAKPVASGGGSIRTAQQAADELNLPVPGTDWKQPEPSNARTFNPLEAAQGGLMQGMTFGFNDEIQAGMLSPIEMGIDLYQGKGLDPGRAYGRVLEQLRADDAAMAEQQPLAFNAGNIAGGVATGLGASKAGLTLMTVAKPTVASMGARGAAEGAIYGGLHGLGSGTDDKIGSAIEGALIGGATGGVLGGVGGAVASRSTQAGMPTVQSLKDEAGALYETARQSGAVLPRAQSMNMAGDVRAIAAADGIVTPTGRINESFPKIADLIRSFDDYATGDLTIDQMQSVRRLIQNALRSTDADERRIAMMAMETFHKYLDPLAPEIAKANQIYHRAMNADVLETLIDVARQKTGQYGRSFDATLREQFGALERQIIKGEVRGFSQAEIEAISQVAQGGNLENALRLLGKAAPSGLLSGDRKSVV